MFKQPLRITFLLPHAGISGGVRVVAIYAARLQARGHKVVILSTPYRPCGLRATMENARHRLGQWMRGERDPSHLNGVPVEHRKLPSMDRIHPDRFPDADVLVATWWETAERIANFPESKGAHAYFIQHYEIHEGQPIDRVKETWRLPMQKIMVARWLADIARDEYGDDTSILVPNAVDLKQFNMPPRSKQAQPTVGLMLAKAKYKGADIALRAFDIARQSVPDLQLAGFGMGELNEEMRMPTGIRYTQMPAQDKIKDIYGSCDAWLFASRSEGFGLPILEAMACRTPVIATPAGAAPELVAAGGGMMVKPESPEDMAAAIVRIAHMRENEWKHMSDAAHATASRYSWDDATDLFEAALRATIARAERGEYAAGAARGAR